MSDSNKSPTEKIFELIKTEIRKLDSFRERREWFDFFLYLAASICVLFTPGVGILSDPLEDVFEAFTSMDYSSAFVLLIFVLCFISFLLKSIKAIKKSQKTFKLVLTIAISFLLVYTLSSLSSKIRFSPDPRGNQISWEEEALVLKDRPEAVIYENNKDALESSRSLFSQPFEVGTVLPISRRKGIDDSEEILRGIAIAQHDWNEAPSHSKLQMVVAIADDGYDDPDNEISEAKKASTTILGYRRILGVIGHFTSDATEETANAYKEKDVVLISPTSTAVRCDPDADNNLEKCLDLTDNVFRTAVDDRAASIALLRHIKEEEYQNIRNNQDTQVNKVAILYESDTRYSDLYRRVFTEEAALLSDNKYSIEIVNGNNQQDRDHYDDCNFSDYKLDAPEQARQNKVRSCLDIAKDKGADTLLLIPSIKKDRWVEEVLLLNHKENYGFKLLGSDSMYQERFVSQNGLKREDSQGMLISVAWHRTGCSDVNLPTLECRAENLKNWKGINWRTATGYDAAQALFHAVEIANKECGLRNRITGLRARCIKPKLSGILAKTILKNDPNSPDSRYVTSSEPIQFGNGDRLADGVVVRAKDESFQPARNS